MLQTLFYIPHRIGPLPVFGWGWLLVVWLLVTPVILILAWRQTRSLQGMGEGSFFWLIVGGAILFLLPNLEAVDARGNTLGLPIRGYGMMMLLGVVSGLGLAVQRAKSMNLDPDLVFAMAFRMFVAGIIGARLFFVMEYWSQFRRETLWATLLEILRFTEGGLVVYGSVIGAFIAAAWYVRQQKLPLLAIADLIAPSLVVGLAFGRIGCLLNGCCFGGICEPPFLPSLQFPAGSPPYVQQLQQGRLLGVKFGEETEPRQLVIEHVDADGLAAARDIHVGDRFRGLVLPPPPFLADPEAAQLEGRDEISLISGDDRSPIRWTLSDLPRFSHPVHPTQLYSALNALLLLALLWCFYPLRPWDGAVFALLMTLYPISRFLIEQIRIDEPGRLGTDFTIAQWVSIGVLLATLALWGYLSRRHPGITYDFGRPASLQET